MPGKSHKTNEAATGACLDDDLLYRYLEKMTTQEEEERIEQHLNECNNCFADVTALTEIIQTPITESEKIEIARSRKISPQEQVEKILKQVEADHTKARDAIVGLTLLEAVRKIWQGVFRYRRYAVAFAVFLVFIIGSFVGVPYYKDASSIAQVERELCKYYQVYVNVDDFAESTPRLSGRYAHQPIFAMAGEEEPAYIADSRQRLKEVFARDAESVKAKQLLAQTFIMRGAYAQADSVLRQIPAAALQEADLLNDQGVLHLAMNDLTAAAQDFAAAIKIEPGFIEARYNLALTKAQTGATAEAIKILEESVKLETDEGWRRAADAILGKLREKND